MRRLAQATKGFTIEVQEGISLPRFDAVGYLLEDWEPAKEGDLILTAFTESTSKKGNPIVTTLWNRDAQTPDTLEAVLRECSRPVKLRLRTPKERAEERLRARKVMEELLTL